MYNPRVFAEPSSAGWWGPLVVAGVFGPAPTACAEAQLAAPKPRKVMIPPSGTVTLVVTSS